LIATEGRLLYITLNGDSLCQAALEAGKRITAARFIGLPMAASERCAFCGTAEGEVWLALPDFRKKTFEIISLASPHQCEIKTIVLPRAKGNAVSADVAGNVCYWTWPKDSRK
jgi:hypothetical protein